MKKLIEEIIEKKSRKITHLKRYYYDPSKDNPVIIEQIKKTGDKEKVISEMRVPLENAPEKIQEIVETLQL